MRQHASYEEFRAHAWEFAAAVDRLRVEYGLRAVCLLIPSSSIDGLCHVNNTFVGDRRLWDGLADAAHKVSLDDCTVTIDSEGGGWYPDGVPVEPVEPRAPWEQDGETPR